MRIGRVIDLPKVKPIIFCLLVMLMLPACAFCEGLVFYVSPEGSDEGTGMADAPFQTLGAAVALARAEKTDEEITIWLRGGIYYLDETLSLIYKDRNRIAFRAYPGETPVLCGAAPVEGFIQTIRDGQTVWAVQISLKPLNALYGEDGALQNARWPKEGYLSVAEPVNKVSSMFVQQRAFFADPALLPERLDGAKVRLLHWWKDELSGVRAYAGDTGRIALNRLTSMSIFKGDFFWLENVLCAPLEMGEWAYDATEGMLYYRPREGETIENTTLYAGTLERLITLESVSGITFEGITFARTAWSIPLRDSQSDFAQAAYDADAAIYIRQAKEIAFVDCVFRDIGAGCIRFDYNVQDASVRGCRFENIGAHAVYIKGKNLRDDPQAVRHITLENNLIAGYGRNYLNAAAILLIHARDVDIIHNEIHDGTYTAISAGWVWGSGFNATNNIRIASNLIYDIGQGILSDMGGIYLLGAQPDTVVTGNIIHGVSALDYGGWGIYLDEGASGILVENNLVYGCSSQGFFQHKGRYNTVRNNIFALNLSGQVGTSDKRASGTFLLTQNLLVGTEPFFYHKYGVERIELGDNLFYTGALPFVNAQAGDFSLIDDPAYAEIGFVPWNYEAGTFSR